MNITTRALHLADAAVALAKVSTTRADDIKLYDEALTVIREARAEQSIVLNDPHPPHRLCECTACLEYWTPLPDCDAFAGGGKPIDHIPDATKMVAPEGYALISIEALKAWGKYDEVRSACRFPAEPAIPEWVDVDDYEEPVTQEPVALDEVRRIAAEYAEPNSQVDSGNLFWALCGALQYIDANLKFNVPTHPIRTKDLTDGELTAIWERNAGDWLACFRAVIAADREKNRG